MTHQLPGVAAAPAKSGQLFTLLPMVVPEFLLREDL
jgi:hypothetical protein